MVSCKQRTRCYTRCYVGSTVITFVEHKKKFSYALYKWFMSLSVSLPEFWPLSRQNSRHSARSNYQIFIDLVSWQSSTHPLLSSKSINCHFIYAMVIHVQLMLSIVINQRRWVGCGVLFVALPGLFVFYMSFWTNRRHLSQDMTKPTKWVYAQRRLRSAWASAQSDLSLLCPLEEGLGP